MRVQGITISGRILDWDVRNPYGTIAVLLAIDKSPTVMEGISLEHVMGWFVDMVPYLVYWHSQGVSSSLRREAGMVLVSIRVWVPKGCAGNSRVKQVRNGDFGVRDFFQSSVGLVDELIGNLVKDYPGHWMLSISLVVQGLIDRSCARVAIAPSISLNRRFVVNVVVGL